MQTPYIYPTIYIYVCTINENGLSLVIEIKTERNVC